MTASTINVDSKEEGSEYSLPPLESFGPNLLPNTVEHPNLTEHSGEEENEQSSLLSNSLGLDLSPDEGERLFKLDLSANPDAAKTKIILAAKLAEDYANGGEKATADQWKSKIYAIHADEALTKEIKAEKLNEFERWNFKRTQSWYAALSWFNSVRLFFVRAVRAIIASGAAFLEVARPKLLPIAGFSFALELAIDIRVIIKNVFRPQPGEKKLPWTKRLSNTLMKDNRWYRMVNAAIWLPINVLAFVFTGGAASYLNIFGFGFDPLNEGVLAWLETGKNKRLLKKIDNRLAIIEESTTGEFAQYNVLQSGNNDLRNLITQTEAKIKSESNLIKHAVLQKEKTDLESKLRVNDVELTKATTAALKLNSDLFTQYKQLKLAKIKLEQSNNELLNSKIQTVLTVVVVAVGMGLILFCPPAGLSFLVGSILVTVIGSIIGGLGKRIYGKKDVIGDFFVNAWNKVTSCFSTQQKAPAVAVTLTVIPPIVAVGATIATASTVSSAATLATGTPAIDKVSATVVALPVPATPILSAAPAAAVGATVEITPTIAPLPVEAPLTPVAGPSAVINTTPPIGPIVISLSSDATITKNLSSSSLPSLPHSGSVGFELNESTTTPYGSTPGSTPGSTRTSATPSPIRGSTATNADLEKSAEEPRENQPPTPLRSHFILAKKLLSKPTEPEQLTRPHYEVVIQPGIITTAPIHSPQNNAH